MAHYPGEGTIPCSGTRRDGAACGNMEIEGLEFCLHHVPDDMLEEAEEITGMRRCRHRFAETDACRYTAVTATEPPMCKVHGANLGSHQSKLAAGRVVEGRVAERVGAIMAEHGEELLNPVPVENPLTELQQLAGEIVTFKNIARKALAYLATSNWRYEKSRMGEQTRAEILVYERALDRCERILVNLAKLHIEDQLTRIRLAQVLRIERALNAALQASGADVEGQDAARQVLRRELTAAG